MTTTRQIARRLVGTVFSDRRADNVEVHLRREELEELFFVAAELAMKIGAVPQAVADVTLPTFTRERPAFVVAESRMIAEHWRADQGLEPRAVVHISRDTFNRLRGRNLDPAQVVRLGGYRLGVEGERVLELSVRRRPVNNCPTCNLAGCDSGSRCGVNPRST